MIRGIFFDAHGVLYERHGTTTLYARRLLAQRGYHTEVAAPDRDHLAALRSEASVGRISAATYWEEFVRMHGVATEGERAELVTHILEHPHEVYALLGAASTLQTLQQREFILGVITDTMYPAKWKASWLAKIGVAEFVDVVVCSTAIGARKPDPAIYLAALSRASVEGREAAFVGHEGRELDGAHNVGMTTVAVNHAPGIEADYYVTSLPDLLTLPIFQGLRR